MPPPAYLDLAQLDAWCGCRPGMTRSQVIAALQAADAEAAEYGDENLTVAEDEWEMELYFAVDGSERLRQLSLDGEAVFWGERRLLGLPMDEALNLVAPHQPAEWTSYDAVAYPFPESQPAASALPVPDDLMLAEGTVWVPSRGLGLVIEDGSVTGVIWRAPQDLPTQFAGPVTDAHRELSRRPDLAEHLQEEASQRAAAAVPKDPMRFLRTALTLATIAALAFTARHGFKEMVLWSNATSVTAKLLGTERGPLKQFFEYLPAPVTRYLPHWLLAGRWSGVPPQTDLYRLEFTDAHGGHHEVRLEAAEFYIPPREIGQEVEVMSVDEDPPRVKGPSRVRDAAFMEHIPWAISIGVVWLLGQAALSILPAVLRGLAPLLRKLLSSRQPFDPDRPELS